VKKAKEAEMAGKAGVPSVGAKVSKQGVSGTSKIPRPIKPYPSKSVGAPRGR
jgi:hypothetical protein